MPVVSLELVDPRFYHLDTALAVLGERTTIAYYPPAFSDESRATSARAVPRPPSRWPAPTPTCSASTPCPTACNVILPVGATGFAEQLRQAGFEPIGDRSVRTAQGRRIRQMLHAGGTSVTMLETMTMPTDAAIALDDPLRRPQLLRRCRWWRPVRRRRLDHRRRGRRYLDCLAAYSAVNFGHRNPEITARRPPSWTP